MEEGRKLADRIFIHSEKITLPTVEPCKTLQTVESYLFSSKMTVASSYPIKDTLGTLNKKLS